MDYGGVLKRAWDITWRWKVLWILGFLASLGSGGGGGSGPTYTTDGSQAPDPSKWGEWSIGPEAWAPAAGAIAALVCLFLFIAIALWVVSVIARGGLIAGVVQVEDDGSTSFGQAWRVGVSRFWTLFGIGVLTALPFIILMIVVGLIFGMGVVAAIQANDFSQVMASGGIMAALCCGGIFCCGMFILGLVLDQIRTYAERAAILEGKGWIDAFVRGWEVIKDNLAPTIVFWVIFFVIGSAVALLIVAGVMVVAFPIAAIFGNSEPGAWMAVPVCCGGVLGFIVFALIGAVVETFKSATWTLVYRELTTPSREDLVEALLEGEAA